MVLQTGQHRTPFVFIVVFDLLVTFWYHVKTEDQNACKDVLFTLVVPYWVKVCRVSRRLHLCTWTDKFLSIRSFVHPYLPISNLQSSPLAPSLGNCLKKLDNKMVKQNGISLHRLSRTANEGGAMSEVDFTQTHPHPHTHTRTHTYIHTHTYTHKHTHTHIYIYVYICTCFIDMPELPII